MQLSPNSPNIHKSNKEKKGKRREWLTQQSFPLKHYHQVSSIKSSQSEAFKEIAAL